jgi:hypothetical protein
MRKPTKRPSLFELDKLFTTSGDFTSRKDMSRKVSIPESTLRAWEEYYLKMTPDAHIHYDAPMSEDASKYRENFTAQNCIDEIRRIAAIDTTKVISRNYFRNHSTISEAVWNQHFGTFSEFKRQAGIVLTRQQHQLEKHIAKHASVTRYKEMSDERKQYAQNYLRENTNRHKIVVIASDLHDKECDEFYLRVLIDTCTRIQPDIIVFGGDIFDLAEFGKYDVDPREWDVVGRVKFVHEKIFAPIRKACPNAQLDFIEGNHEARLLKHLCDATPALKVLLSDLHGMGIAQLLGLDKFQINYVAKCDLHTYSKSDTSKEIRKNYKVYYNSFMVHHFPEGKQLGMPGINGHHHTFEMSTHYNESYGSYQWLQIGSGHRRDATYCNGQKWSMGFAIAHVDTETRNTIFETVVVTDRAIVGGMYYVR